MGFKVREFSCLFFKVIKKHNKLQGFIYLFILRYFFSHLTRLKPTTYRLVRNSHIIRPKAFGHENL